MAHDFALILGYAIEGIVALMLGCAVLGALVGLIARWAIKPIIGRKLGW